jgi:hypothetical protein
LPANTTPQPQQTAKLAPAGLGHQRQHRRHGVLGEQLLPRQDHHQKAERIAQTFDQERAGQPLHVMVEQGARQHRETHGHAGRQRRPAQRRHAARQLLFALAANRLVQHHRPRRA